MNIACCFNQILKWGVVQCKGVCFFSSPIRLSISSLNKPKEGCQLPHLLRPSKTSESLWRKTPTILVVFQIFVLIVYTIFLGKRFFIKYLLLSFMPKPDFFLVSYDPI